MDILLTYQTALQAVRLEEYPVLAREWDERTGIVPERIPRMADVRRMLTECPALGRLSLPLQLLVSSDATSHSCELFTRRVSHDIYPGHAFVRIDREVLVVSPELLPMQFCLHVPRLEGALLVSELCGTYAQRGVGETVRRAEPLALWRNVSRTIALMSGSRGARRAREALPLSCECSSSPEESKLAALVQAPRGMGGYGVRATPPSEVGLKGLWDTWAAERRGGGILLLHPRPLPPAVLGTRRNGVVLRHTGPSDPPSEEDTSLQREELGRLGIELHVVTPDQARDADAMDDLMDSVRAELGLPLLASGTQRPKRLELLSELERIGGTLSGGGAPDGEP